MTEPLPESTERPLVLIADDVATNIRVLGQAIRNDFRIIVATDGIKAVEMATGNRPDLILLDIMMPGMDGYEVIAKLKEDDRTRDIPVIFITSKTEVEDETRGFAAGVVDYITKPFRLQLVRARVRTHVRVKMQQDKLKQMTANLEQLNQTKNKFLGTAAHDLRNPLSGIRGLSQVLLEGAVGDVSDEQREMLQMIFEASDGMLALVNDLLDVAVIESGRFDLRLVPQELKPLIVDRMRVMAPIYNQKQIEVVQHLDNVEPFLFDKDRILQVFDNLFSNAVKFSPPGSTIRVNLRQSGETCVFEVEDEGPGIRKDDQKKLFGAFQKLEAQPTGGEKSTGLGLSIVKKILEAHDAHIDVSSEVGHGTTMTILLPMRQGEPKETLANVS